MNRAAAAVLVAASVAGLTVFATGVAAQDEPPPTSEPPFTASGTVELELVDQSFDLAPDGDIELTYRLTGDLATVAELAPPTTPTTTTTTTTITTITTSLPSEADGSPATAAPPTDPPTTQVAPISEPTPNTEPPDTEPAPTTTLPPPVPLTVGVLNYQPIDDPRDLPGILGSNPRSARFSDQYFIDGVGFLDARLLIEVDSPTAATLRVTVPTDTDPSVAERLKFEENGIHPILVQVSVDGQVVARHGTVVERRSNTTRTPPPIDLSFIASIDDPGPTADGAAYADAVDELDELLGIAAVVDSPITLDIPPSVASAAVESGNLRDDATEILLDDEVLAAPATPFDVSSATAVGRVDAFVRQLSAGEDDIRSLLDVVTVRDVWLTTEPLSAAGAQVLRQTLGVRYLAMPADVYLETVANTEPSSGSGSGSGSGSDADDSIDGLPARDRFVELDLPDGSTMPTLIIDDEFGAMFETQRTDEILAEQTPTEWALETVAEWRLAQYAAPRSDQRNRLGHLIAAPGLGAFDPTLLIALESFAERTDAIRFSPASGLASVTDRQEQPPGAALPDTAGPSLEARLERIALVEADLTDTATMLPDDDPRPAQWSRRLDSFVSTSFGDAAAAAQLDALVAEAAGLRSGVVAPDPFTFTLTGREEQAIKVRVENTLDEPLKVVLRLSSPRLSFPEGDMLVTLAPLETTVVDVAVMARSNGTSPVTVEILTPSPAERALIEPVRLTARVNAFTGLGQVLTAAFVLILATWWISSWRSKRRARDAGDTVQVHPASGTDPVPAE